MTCYRRQSRTERQCNAFVRWMNDVLSSHGLEVIHFPEDLKNGVILIHLAEILTKTRCKKYISKPTLNAHSLDNLEIAFRMLRKSNLRMVNIGCDDILNGNKKMILGLLWSVIRKFQLCSHQISSNIYNINNNANGNRAISESEALMAWVHQQLKKEMDNRETSDSVYLHLRSGSANETQPVQRRSLDLPSNFNDGWEDGQFLMRLINAIQPNTISVDLYTNCTQEACIDQVLWAAYKLGIPCLLTKEDILYGADSKAMMTWLSYFKQESESDFPRAQQQEIRTHFLLNWINSILATELGIPAINKFSELLSLKPTHFQNMLCNILHLDESVVVECTSVEQYIEDAVCNYNVLLMDCTVNDILVGNQMALEHFISRLMKCFYNSSDNDYVLNKINHYVGKKNAVTDIDADWKSGVILVSLANTLLADSGAVLIKDYSMQSIETAIALLCDTLGIPANILSVDMVENMSASVVTMYISLLDYYWKDYLRSKLESAKDSSTCVDFWMTWASMKLNTNVESISSLMTMEYLFPLMKCCFMTALPQVNESKAEEDSKLDIFHDKYHTEDMRGVFLKNVADKYTMVEMKVEAVINYDWKACEELLHKLFVIANDLPFTQLELEKVLLQFFCSKINLYPIVDLHSAWQSQQLLIGLYHAFAPQSSVHCSGVAAIKHINDILNIPQSIMNGSQSFRENRQKLRNLYLSLVMHKMKTENVSDVNTLVVKQDLQWLVNWTKWILNNAQLLSAVVSVTERDVICSDLQHLLFCYESKKSEMFGIPELSTLLNYFQLQTKCTQTYELCEWLNKWINIRKIGCEDGKHLRNAIDIRQSLNSGLILQQLAYIVNPLLLEENDLLTVQQYYGSIIETLSLPHMLVHLDCDTLCYNSETSVLGFLSLIKQRLEACNYSGKYLLPWIQFEILPDSNSGIIPDGIQLNYDLQAIENYAILKKLMIVCLSNTNSISIEMLNLEFAQLSTMKSLLTYVINTAKLINLSEKYTVVDILNGNPMAKNDLLLRLFEKYYNIECNELQAKVQQVLSKYLYKHMNAPFVEDDEQFDIQSQNYNRARELLLAMNRLLLPSTIMSNIAIDISPMIALGNICHALDMKLHFLTENDIQLNSIPFQTFVIQADSKLMDIGNEWLKNWVNQILQKKGAFISHWSEILGDDRILLTLYQRIFGEIPNGSLSLKKLRNTMLAKLNIPRNSQTSKNLTGADFTWFLFKYEYNMHKIDDTQLGNNYYQFLSFNNNISWDDGRVIQLLAKKCTTEKDAECRFDSMVADYEQNDEKTKNALTFVFGQVLRMMPFIDSDELHLVSNKGRTAIVHILLSYANKNRNRFLIPWINWLLNLKSSSTDLTVMADVVNIPILTSILQIKENLKGNKPFHESNVQSISAIVDSLCDTKMFDYETFNTEKLCGLDVNHISEFGWSLFKYFYDIIDEDTQCNTLCEYFEGSDHENQITDIFGKDFNNGRAFSILSQNIAINNNQQIEESLIFSKEIFIEYLLTPLKIPLFFDFDVNSDLLLKNVSFHTRIAFLTILKQAMIEENERREQERKTYSEIDSECIFKIGTFVKFLSDENKILDGVIVGYNSHSKMYDIQVLANNKRDVGGQIYRFLSSKNIHVNLMDLDQVLCVNENAYVLANNENKEECYLPCKISQVDDEGMVWCRIDDTPMTVKNNMANVAILVPHHHLKKSISVDYDTSDEDDDDIEDVLNTWTYDEQLDALKAFLRQLLEKSHVLTDGVLDEIQDYQRRNGILNPEIAAQALEHVLAEFQMRRNSGISVNSNYMQMLDNIMANVHAIMEKQRSLQISFTVTSGKSMGGDAAYINVVITGPIDPNNKRNNKNCIRHQLRERDIKDLGDGRYKCKFLSVGNGLYNIRVKIFGKESPLSPFQFCMNSNGGYWLQQDSRGNIKEVKSDTLTAKASAKVSEKERLKKLKNAQKFTKKQTQQRLKELMKLPQTTEETLERIERIMRPYKDFLIKKEQISEFQKTDAMKSVENELLKNHLEIILSLFKSSMAFPGHILTKYPNSRFAKPHTRRVKISGIMVNKNRNEDVGGHTKEMASKMLFMWTAEKFCKLTEIRYFRAGISDEKTWKLCAQPEENCFEMGIKKKVLCFHCANVNERDFIIKGFELLLKEYGVICNQPEI